MPTIMVVDDTPVDRRLAGGLLEAIPQAKVLYAEHGGDALNRMEESLPDLVVTDLQMPEMDGLELVTRIRLQHPNVPVVLITSKGSESIAVEALEQGASGYVPKSQLADRLSETVEELLVQASADKSYQRLMACQRRLEFSYELDNDVELIDALVDLIQQVVSGMELSDHTGSLRIGVAVKAALLNALYRGNLEISFEQMQETRDDLLAGQTSSLVEERRQQSPYTDRKINVEACLQREEARIVIRDEGPGFAHTAFHPEELSVPGGLDAHAGRGLVLMHSFMDEVHFNESGNETTLIKRRDVDRFKG